MCNGNCLYENYEKKLTYMYILLYPIEPTLFVAL